MQIFSLYEGNRHFLWNSRWTLSNEGNEEVHVVDEGVVVGAGQVFGLVLVCGSGVVVHVDEAIFHPGDVAQVLLQVLGVKGVLAVLWRWSEHCCIYKIVLFKCFVQNFRYSTEDT